MESVLYCGCTANAYMPFHEESVLFHSSPKPSLFRRGFSLFLSPTRRARRRYLRDISLALAAGLSQ